MTDQTNEQQPNGGKHNERQDTADVVRAKAEHRQALARIESEDRRTMSEMFRNMPIPLRVMFDPMLNERVKAAAEMMAEAEGFTPRHLLHKTEACFVVVSKALTWRLDPQAVAASTYQTPEGKVGYEGKLIQAIIEGSGKLAKPIGQGDYFGDWSKVEGRFRIVRKTTQSGKEWAAPEPQWEYFGPDEEGLGVRYEIHLIDQDKPLKFEFKLRSAYPRNAVTWPTRPQQQLHYAAMRALGNVVCPSLIMGVPFQDELAPEQQEMKDVTPPPAPPPVDLEKEGIAGGGQMTDDDETRQDGGGQPKSDISKTNSGRAMEQSEEADRNKPSWTIGGKTYRQPGRVQSVLIEAIAGIRELGDLDSFDQGEMAELISSLPAANRQAVENAIDHRRSVLEAEQERAPAPDSQDDDDEPQPDQGEEQTRGQFNLLNQ